MSDSVKLLFNVLVNLDYWFCKADAKTAFLHSPVPLDINGNSQLIYMLRPKGLTDADMPELVQLDRCLYGLPMAPAAFRVHSDQALKKIGFVPLESDPRVYLKTINNFPAYVMVHVDDFGILARDQATLDIITSGLSETYSLVISDNDYLGMHIDHNRELQQLTLTQTAYVDELCEDYELSLKENYPLTPMTGIDRPVESSSNPLLFPDGISLYQSKVGALLYLATHTRPDILYAVNMASRRTKAPTAWDMDAADRILYYLVGTKDLGLRFTKTEGIILYGTVDASYGTHDDRKSHTALTLHLGQASGSWLTKSKKQTVTADSSTVAEYIAAHSAAKEIQWARNMLAELGFPQTEPTILLEDNLSTIHMIKNDSHTAKTKHLDIRYNYLRECERNKQLTMVHCPTKEMTSDIATKATPPVTFLHLRPKLLGMHAIAEMDCCNNPE
jgi:hypothetical protein